jgi:hypothetical protein
MRETCYLIGALFIGAVIGYLAILNHRGKMRAKKLDQAFDEWLLKGGHNGEYSLRAAFEAGARFRLSNESDEKCYQAIEPVTETHETLVKIHAPASDGECHTEDGK